MKNISILKAFTFFAEQRFFSAMRTVFFAISLDNSYTTAGFLLSVMVFTSVIFDIPLGALSSFLGVSCYLFSGDFYFFIIWAAIEGIAIACYSWHNEAILYEALKDHSEENNFPRHLGSVLFFFQLGMIVSSLGSIMVSVSPKILVIMSLPPLILNVILSCMIQSPSISSSNIKTSRVSLKESFSYMNQNKKLQFIGIINSIEYALTEVLYYFWWVNPSI